MEDLVCAETSSKHQNTSEQQLNTIEDMNNI